MNFTIPDIQNKANDHRIKILKMINKMGKGHVGGAFSCIDILSALYYGNILNISPETFTNSDRNRVILSKGHAAIAQYVILQDLGFFSDDELFKMNNGGILGEHPDPGIPGVEFVSGSLGHGLAVGIGMALASRMDNLDLSVYVILGDGECHEGSVWEAAMLASHLRLTNLVVVVDRNRLCIHGDTEKINSLEPLRKKWEAFGWEASEIDGHDIDECISSLTMRNKEKPSVLIANTVKGKGVSFMENESSWHHGSVSDQILKSALGELSND